MRIHLARFALAVTLIFVCGPVLAEDEPPADADKDAIPAVQDPVKGNWAYVRGGGDPDFGWVKIKPYSFITFTAKTASVALTDLNRAKEKGAKGNWEEAATLVKKITEGKESSLVDLREAGELIRPVSDGNLFWSVRRYAHWKISKWPKEGLAAYRKLADANARNLLDKAKKDPFGVNDEPLRTLIHRFYNSSVGGEAIELLGDIAFQNGRMSEAEHWYSQLIPEPDQDRYVLRFPDPNPERSPLVYGKLLLVRGAQGDRKIADHVPELFAKRFPNNPAGLDFAGRRGRDAKNNPVSLANIVQRVLREDKFDEMPGSSADWDHLGGNSSGQNIVPTSSLENLGLSTNRIAGCEEPPKTENEKFSEGYHPLLFGGKIWVADDAKVIRSEYKPSIAKKTAEAPSSAVWYRSASVVPHVRIPLSAARDLIFTRFGERTIGAVSATEPGKLRWEVFVTDLRKYISPEERNQEERDDDYESIHFVFEGTPVTDGKRVFVSMLRRSFSVEKPPHPLVDTSHVRTHYLVALDAFTGKVDWVSMIGAYQWTESGVYRYWPHADNIPGPAHYDYNFGRQLVSVLDGQVFYQSNDGAFAAIDNANGEIQWLVRYRGSLRKNGVAQPPFSAPVANQHRVATVPNDLNSLFVFDSHSGTVKWEYDLKRPDGQRPFQLPYTLLGFHRDQLILTGPELAVLDVSRKQRLWDWQSESDKFVGYRGILTSSQVIWPSSEGFLTFSLDRRALLPTTRLKADGREASLVAAGGYLVGVNREESLVFAPENPEK